jgi:hypothetical protein
VVGESAQVHGTAAADHLLPHLPRPARSHAAQDRTNRSTADNLVPVPGTQSLYLKNVTGSAQNTASRNGMVGAAGFCKEPHYRILGRERRAFAGTAAATTGASSSNSGRSSRLRQRHPIRAWWMSPSVKLSRIRGTRSQTGQCFSFLFSTTYPRAGGVARLVEQFTHQERGPGLNRSKKLVFGTISSRSA